MTLQFRKDFRKFLDCGAWCNPPGRTICAKRGAETLAKWREAEGTGIVRLTATPEQDNYFDVYGKPEAYLNAHGRRISAGQAAQELTEQIERDGVYLVRSEYLFDGYWCPADSVGMCVYENPLDPFQNDYVVGLMDSALEKICAIQTKT